MYESFVFAAAYVTVFVTTIHLALLVEVDDVGLPYFGGVHIEGVHVLIVSPVPGQSPVPPGNDLPGVNHQKFITL